MSREQTQDRPTMTINVTDTPARDLPNAMWMDVLTVLQAHGLDPRPLDVKQALYRIINETPTEDGGRG